jgi:outer membrane protein assembly factor BamD
MRKNPLFFSIFLFMCLLPGVPSLHAVEGRKKEKATHPKLPARLLSKKATARLLLERADQDEKSGKLNQAIRKYRLLVRQPVLSKQDAPEAHFRLAKLLQKRNQLQKAFIAYQTLIKRYPKAKRFNDSIAEQIRIANFYLEKPDSAFTRILMSNAEIAQGMYEEVLTSAPFGYYAPLAQFNLCLAHERQGHARNATQAYQALLERYPDSGLASDAQYQIAHVYMRVGLSRHSQDLVTLSRARDAFQDYLLQCPETKRRAQILENIGKINSKESSMIYRIAKFYDRRRSYKSAYIYYSEVLQCQTASQEAMLAKARIKVIRNKVGV